MNLRKESALTYCDGQLHMEDVALSDVGASIGTPVYCYSSAVIERNFRRFEKAFASISPKLCYAVKANSNIAVLRLLASLGAGADVVSEGELRRAQLAGINSDRIVFSGVGKTRQEIAFALQSNISQLNIESESELEMIVEIASSMKVQAPVALRVNPDIGAETNAKITTGTGADKFGIPASRVPHVYKELNAHSSIAAQGLAVHIGSQITDLESFRRAYCCLVEIVHGLQKSGLSVPRLDLGGGLGIAYRDESPPSIEEYAAVVAEVSASVDCELILEPGRCLVGNAGVLLSQVIRSKSQQSRSFVVLDAAINDLLRPGLYEAHHGIIPVVQSAVDSPRRRVDFVGPVCETSDTFCRDEQAPLMAPDDLVVILSAGAYGAVMASTYNTRPLVPEVMISGKAFETVRRRGSYDQMLEQDLVPSWLASVQSEIA